WLSVTRWSGVSRDHAARGPRPCAGDTRTSVATTTATLAVLVRLLQLRRGRRGRHFTRLERVDLAALLETELAFGYNPFADIEDAAHYPVAVAHFAGHHDRLHLHRVVALHLVDVVAIGPALHRLRRNHQAAVDRADQQLHVDELARPQFIVLVVELGLEPERAGGGVDLVVDDLEHAAAGDRVRIDPIQRRDLQRLDLGRATNHVEVLLGQGEHHVD